MADLFERMLKDLQCEHARQLAELNAQIVLLKEEIAQGRASDSRATHRVRVEAIPTSQKSLSLCSQHVGPQDSIGSPSSPKSLPLRSQRVGHQGSIGSDTSQPLRKRHPMRSTLHDVRKIFYQAHDGYRAHQSANANLDKNWPRCCSLKAFVESSRFEALIASLIMASTLCNALAVQFQGLERGYSLGIAGYGHRDDLWGTGVAILSAVDVAFSVVFILELLFRAIALKCKLFCSFWNWLDILVVLSGVVDLALGGGSGKAIRMLRIMKVVRLLKALRAGGSFFNVLHVLMASIRASFSTLCWALIMIIPVQVVCALVITYVLGPFYDRDDVSTESKQKVFLYFGTFSRSLITFFEILLANYATPCRVLVENVGEEYGAIIIAYRCVCGFSVLCVVQAVFLQQSMKVVSQDSEVMLREKSLSEKNFTKNLERLFWSLDLKGDGHLTRDEFAMTLHNDDVRVYCHALGLDPHDLEDIYHLVDDGDGVIITDFMAAARQIRKQARTLDMARVLANSIKIRKCLGQVHDLMVQGAGSQSTSVGQTHVRTTSDAGTGADPMSSGFLSKKLEL